MAQGLVVSYSSYGHGETMPGAIADGARAAYTEVTVTRVAALVPEDTAQGSGFKLDQAARVAEPSNWRVENNGTAVPAPPRPGGM